MGVKRESRASERTEDVLYDIIRHVRPLHRYLAQAVEDRLEGTGITVGMRAVLERLHDDGPQTVPQVSRSLALGRQFIQRLVNTSLELELIKSVANPAHLRSSLLELTPKGRAAFLRIRQKEQSVLHEVARTLQRDDVEAALRVVAHLTREFRRMAQEGGGKPK